MTPASMKIAKSGVAASALAASALGGAAWAVRGKSSSVFSLSVWHGSRSSNAIALTFDDGPSLGTPVILDLLDQYRVPATFFQIGANVQALPAIAREVGSRGHEIGNHSFTHPLFAFKSGSFIRSEFARAQQSIQNATGQNPAFLRAPFGVRWFGFRRVPLTGVMWDVIARDWKLPAEKIAHRVLSRTRNGSILCLHDGRALDRTAPIENTVQALRWILPALLERGFRFQTVSQLLCPIQSQITN